jgi:Abnormal spindle-like microcephaly-assoc'd, ASPM-SPD-2-Hydin
VNGTFVFLLRPIRLARRDLGRGPFVCLAMVLSAAAALFLLQQTPKPRHIVAASSKTAPIALSRLAARNAAQRLANLGWAFEPNVGQSASEVKFLSRAHDATVFLTDDSVYLSWTASTHGGQQAEAAKRDFVRFEFAGAGRGTKRAGETLLPGKTNYLIGRDARQWHTDVPHYAAVQYAGLYPGVDARFYGGAQGLEYDLTAARGSDLQQILLRVSGADTVHLDPQGNLLMRIGARQLTMKRPYMYQLDGGVRKSVVGGYRLLSGNEVGFEVGKYRADLPLVVDPSISVAYTTFLGGAGAEKGNSVAVDSSGLIYVGGTTTLPSFPETTTTFTGSTGAGPLDGTSNLFVAKIDPSQSGSASLIYLTFIGGSGNDQGGMIALDNSPASATPPGPPNLAILGWSTSPDFPITVGSEPAGSPNLTVSDLNGAGNGFIYSEYFGGSGVEATQNAGGIATDSSGDVFVTSDTTSANLPVTSTAIQPTFTGPSDGVLAEFATGTGTVVYCTYFGLNATTVGSTGVAIDGSGNAYVAGFTSTATTTFTNTFQATYPGGSLDGFVMEINPATSGTAGLTYGSFIGGTVSDQVMSIGVDTATPADAYLTGVTQSSNLIPSTGVTNSPFQSSLAGSQNGFFAVINQSTGTPVLQYLTYLGGSGTDAAQGVAVFSPTQVYVAGSTTSANFPSLCSLQGFSGTQDAFLAQFNPSVGGTSSLLGTTFLGGSFTAEANAVGAGPAGNAIIFGDTVSPDYPLAGNPQTGFQITCTSCAATPPLSDAVLTKVDMSATAQACVAFSPAAVTVGSFADGTSAPPVNILLTNDGGASLNVSSVTVAGANSTDFSLANNTCVTSSPIAPTGTCNFSITFTPSIIGPETAQLQVTDNGVGSPQMLTLNGTGTGVGITLSPTSLSFPNTAQGQVDPSAMTALLTNTSNDNLTVQSSITGTNPTDFEFATSNTCTSVIVPGGTCTIGIQFAPNEPSPPATGLPLSAQDVLSIVDQTNNSTQTVTVSLSGTEVPAAPGIVLSPTSLAFSSQNVGGATAPQPITVTNNGSAPLVISSVTIVGTNPGDFSETDNCVASSPLAPAPAPTSTCTISVTFKPTATGPRAANVSVADNASGSPQTVSLTGTGTAAGVALTPSILTFAGQNPGTPSSPPQTVTLRNTGTGPLTISSIAITGTNSGDFAQTNNCPIGPAATLSAGAACSIAVTFSPTGTGPRSASLSVSDNSTPSLQVVALSGIGTVPNAQFSVSGIGIEFGNVIVGAQSSSQAVQLSNSGNGTLVITKVGFVGANPGDFQAAGSCVGAGGASVSVAAGSNCTVSVTFAPTAAGSRAATLSVTDNAPNSPQQLPVTGTATDFQLSAVSGGTTSATVTAGETATFSLEVAPVNGFTGTLAMSSANPIPASTCTVAPTQVVISGGQAVGFTVTVTTTAPTVTSRVPFFTPPANMNLRIVVGLWLLAFALLTLWKWKSRSQRRFRPAVLLAGVLLLASCGGGGGNSSPTGTPSGTYTVTITGTISGIMRTVNLSITVQ